MQGENSPRYHFHRVSKDQLVYKDTGLEVEWQTTVSVDPTYGCWDVVWPNLYGGKSWNI